MRTLFMEQSQQEEYDATSLEYVKCRVEKTVDGVAVDPTADDVKFAFTTRDSAAGAVFYAGSWETAGVGEYYARCLIGPGGTTTLVAGNTYWVWVKITDSPEIPVKSGGILVVS